MYGKPQSKIGKGIKHQKEKELQTNHREERRGVTWQQGPVRNPLSLRFRDWKRNKISKRKRNSRPTTKKRGVTWQQGYAVCTWKSKSHGQSG